MFSQSWVKQKTQSIALGAVLGALSFVFSLLAVPIAPQLKINLAILPLFLAGIIGSPATAVISGFVGGFGPWMNFGSWWAVGELPLTILIVWFFSHLKVIPPTLRSWVGGLAGVAAHVPLVGFPLQYLQGVPAEIVWGVPGPLFWLAVIPKNFGENLLAVIIICALVMKALRKRVRDLQIIEVPVKNTS